MATINLNIYSADKRTVEKTYTAETYDLMLGTVEDIMQVIDVDKMSDNVEITKMVLKSFKQLKPFIKDIFPDATDDDLKRVKIKELIPMFIQVFKTVIDDLDIIKTGN